MKYLALTLTLLNATTMMHCGYISLREIPIYGKRNVIFSGWGPLNPIVCDHFRSTEYFIESLSPKSTHVMKGFPCTDGDGFDRGRCLKCNEACPVMGYDAVQSGNRQIQGRHYLYTAGSTPFCGN